MKESESEVAQLCPTLCDLMDCSPPGSSIHGVFQARVLEWVAMSFSIKQVQIKVTLGLAITYKAALNTLLQVFFFGQMLLLLLDIYLIIE